jgi:hypothetical protein
VRSAPCLRGYTLSTAGFTAALADFKFLVVNDRQ